MNERSWVRIKEDARIQGDAEMETGVKENPSCLRSPEKQVERGTRMKCVRVMKNSQSLILLTIVLAVVVSGCSVQPKQSGEPSPVVGSNDSSIDDWYIYPVTPQSAEWGVMTVQSKLDACRIPDDTLKTLSDNSLVKAIADFPFLVDLYVLDDISDAVEFFPQECDAYKEVLDRQDPGHIMLNGLNALPVNEDEAKDHYLHDTLGMLILFDERLDGSYTRDEIIEVANHTCAALLVHLDEETQYDLPESDRRIITLSDGSQVLMLWFMDGRPEGTSHTI